MNDFTVIGGGLVGLSTAWQLLKARPGARVLVLEKERAVACHQSGRNSGVIHAGVYYEPGSLKARLCRAGLKETYSFCAEHGVPHARCGKLIVATTALEESRLAALATRATANGVPLEWLDAAQLRAAEPAVSGRAALKVHETGMADYPAMARTLVQLIEALGGTVALGVEITDIRERADCLELQAPDAVFTTRQLVVCAGLQGDRLARRAGLALDFAIVPFRGNYFRLPAHRAGLIRHHIYPVPDPGLPFLGIHLTRLIDGGISLGPSAMLAFAREGYALTRVSARDVADMCIFPGLPRLLWRHRRAGLSELACALSPARYLREAQRYCPELTQDDLLPMPSGVRAQAVSREGHLLHDFLIRRTARAVFVCNAPSPAATACLPIGAEIVREMLVG